MSLKLFPRESKKKKSVEIETRGHEQKGGSVQTCTAKVKQHTIRWVSQMPAVTGNRRGSGPGSDTQRQKIASQWGLVCTPLAGTGTPRPGKVLSSHPNILGLFTSGAVVLLKDMHHTSIVVKSQTTTTTFFFTTFPLTPVWPPLRVTATRIRTSEWDVFQQLFSAWVNNWRFNESSSYHLLAQEPLIVRH